MKRIANTSTALLADLLSIEPIEPSGWFCYINYHFHFRYPPSKAPAKFAFGELQEFAQRFEQLWEKHPEQAAKAFGVHAWELGAMQQIAVADRCWKLLPPLPRGAFLAGYSESDHSHGGQEWIAEHLNDVAFSPESACQLGCNAIRYGLDRALETIFTSQPNWNAPIDRNDWAAGGNLEWQEILNQLSNHLIDRLLEAAIISRNIEAMRTTLRAGANPDLPLWILERSFNERQSSLSYVCEHWNLEAVRVLLDAGANPRGTPFGQIDFPLFCALYQNHDEIADLLLTRGAKFTSLAETPSHRRAMCAFVPPVVSDDYGLADEQIAWVKSSLSGLVPLTSIEEKAAFHQGNAQGGCLQTVLQVLLRQDDLERLKKYEAQGADTRLTAEEVCSAIYAKAEKCLHHLLAQNGPETWLQVVEVIREEYPSFAAIPPP